MAGASETVTKMIGCGGDHMPKQGNVRPYSPKLLMTVHGIRTDGSWQKQAASVLGPVVGAMESFDYGRYGTFSFFRPSKNRKLVDRFYEWYGMTVAATRGVDLSAHDKRPSCIAHSFGTWLVGMAMLKHPDVKFDKLIFNGSVLPADFDWERLIARDQVGLVCNECGTSDLWPRMAARFVRGTGDAGSRGFESSNSVVMNERRDDFAHSDFHLRQHMAEQWKPFIARPPFPLQVVQGRSIATREAFETMLRDVRADIDERIYGGQPNYRQLAIPEGRSIEWTDINPDIYTFLVDRNTGRPGGYINSMPLSEDAYAEIKSGRKLDKDIEAAEIETFEPGSELRIYLMSIAILPEHRIHGEGLMDQAYVRLTAGLEQKLLHYARLGVRVKSLLAITWTAQGEKICRHIGMDQIGRDASGHNIYELELAPLIDRPGRLHASLAKLLNQYRKRPPR
ncbi:MAG TPA: hypothetical protein VF552_01650 [Allosphingosinicella sp.]